MKKRLTGATFDASAQTVVHANFSDITLAGIQLIVNVTDQIIIYNFADTTKGGTLATDTLTLEFDTTSMSDTDELMILVEDGSAEVQVDIVGALPAGDNNIGNVDIASAIPAGTNNIGDVDVLTVPADPFGANADAASTTGSISAKLRSLATNLNAVVSGSEVQVDVVGALPAGTNAIGKLAANSGVDIGDVTLTAGTAAVGKLLPPDVDVTTHTNYAKKYYTNSGAVTDGIIWSPAAGTRWHVVSMFINVSAAATVTLEDDKAGGDEAVMKMELAANSGTVINFGEKYPLASGEDAADLIITTSAGNVYATVTGYEI